MSRESPAARSIEPESPNVGIGRPSRAFSANKRRPALNKIRLSSLCGPIHDASVHVGPLSAWGVGRGAWVETPDQSTILGSQRDNSERGSRSVKDAVYDDRRRLNLTPVCRQVFGVIDPCHAKLRDVAGVDLVEGRIARVSRRSTGRTPIGRWRARPPPAQAAPRLRTTASLPSNDRLTERTQRPSAGWSPWSRTTPASHPRRRTGPARQSPRGTTTAHRHRDRRSCA